jgi:hypothetical protein
MNIDAVWTNDSTRPGKTTGKNIMLYIIGFVCLGICAWLVVQLLATNKA